MKSQLRSFSSLTIFYVAVVAGTFCFSQTPKVVTVAGGYINDGQKATSAALQFPEYAARDSKGNLYVADHFNHRMRKINTSGYITTVAGTGISGFSGDGGSAKLAKISFPTGVLIDSAGNVLFSDAGNSRIRKISTTGVITTIAGTGVAGFSGDGGPATSAEVNDPSGLHFDAAGNLYFADTFNNRIRMIDQQGIINTVAGNGMRGHTGDGGPATQASLSWPQDVIFDSAGNFYIADTYNFAVRMVNTSQIINTIAGAGGVMCDGDGGPAISANISGPDALLVESGTLVMDNTYCGTIRTVNLNTNIINTIAGTTFGFDGNGHLAKKSRFGFNETGLLLDGPGNLVVVDTGNNEIRTINKQTQIVTALAGGYTGDGKMATLSALNSPSDITFDSAGNMYIADWLANRVRKISTTGTISTFAGTGVSGYTGDGGPATQATLNGPVGVAADSLGNVYIAETYNNVVRKVDKSGIITTFARDPRFSSITNVAADRLNNLYISDNCVVWKMTPAKALSIYAGELNNCGYNGDEIPATQALINPFGIAVDSNGNLYIADFINYRVRMVDTHGIIHTVAGNGTAGFSGDGGLAKNAQLNLPEGVSVDAKGNIYIADEKNRRIRLVNTQGIIATFAGTGLRGYNGNGLPATQTNIDVAVAVRVNSMSIPYVVDGSSRVRKIH